VCVENFDRLESTHIYIYLYIYGCVFLCKCMYGGGVDGRTMENIFSFDLIGIAFKCGLDGGIISCI